MMRIILLFVSFFIILTPSGSLYSQTHAKTVVGISSERLARYDNFVKSEIEAGKIPGAASLIVHHGEVVHQSALGYSSLSDKRPIKLDDIFYIQSMTKPIITVAFMMLYENGHFQLTDPVSKYLPSVKNLRVIKNVDDGIMGETEPLKREITIADLLSHTAGFTHGLGPSKFEKEFLDAQFTKQHKDIQSRVVNLLSMPLIVQPGTKWVYSSGPDILSVLIEQFSGLNTQTFLAERIFKPLGMKDTGYNLSKAQQSRLVQLHAKNATGTLVNSSGQVKMEGNTIWSGVNALFSTAADYMTFCQMLINGGKYNDKQILSRKTIELMTYNHVGNLFSKPGEGFGYGFAVLTDVGASDGLGSQGLFYWGGAFNTHFFIDPKEELVAIFMTQTDSFTWYYHEKLRQLVYQAVVD